MTVMPSVLQKQHICHITTTPQNLRSPNITPFVDNKFKAEMIRFLFKRVENIVGTEENVDDQHYLLFSHNVFNDLSEVI